MKTWHLGASTGIRHIHLNIIQIHKIKDRKQDEGKKGVGGNRMVSWRIQELTGSEYIER